MKTNYRSTPSQLMQHWLETEGDREWRPLLTALAAGTHVNNPYHNMTHMLGMAWYARHIYRIEVDQVTWLPRDEAIVVASGLLHDFDHGGGFDKDDVYNINAALMFIASVAGQEILRDLGFQDNVDIIQRNISCTRFDASTRSFPLEPSDAMQRAMRDADLMSIYSDEGRASLLGLFEEITGSSLEDASLDTARNYLLDSAKFLSEARMYTRYGKRMQQQQLPRALRSLVEHIAFASGEHEVTRAALLEPLNEYLKGRKNDPMRELTAAEIAFGAHLHQAAGYNEHTSSQ